MKRAAIPLDVLPKNARVTQTMSPTRSKCFSTHGAGDAVRRVRGIVYRDYVRHSRVFTATQWGVVALVSAKVASIALQSTSAGTAFVGWLMPNTY